LHGILQPFCLNSQCMKAYIFPGQASQFVGMGKDMYESSPLARSIFEQANDLLGFRITDVMFEGTEENLKQTKITQPAVFLHSVVRARLAGDDFRPDMVAGHSLGEFSALVANGALSFESGLQLVLQRALAMQKACEAVESTMAALIGLDDEQVEAICAAQSGTVVAANYNCPGQLVISGTVEAVEAAVEAAKAAGAKMAVVLPVGGAFHSPLMAPAREELRAAIEGTDFRKPICPIYQNVNALPESRPEVIQQNLIEQLTAPVRWTQTMLNMIADGATHFYEVGGNGKTLRAFVKRIDRSLPADEL
jgi:[acyl-carrier-protein] S-malonyltransferase